MKKGAIAKRNGGNGGYQRRKPVVNTKKRKMKQNIGRQGSVKTPKS